VIVTGEVEVWTEQVHVATLGSGECFGELAILADATRSATVRAKTDLYCLKLARDDFEDLLDVSPGLSMAIMRVLTARLRESVTHDTSLLAEQGA
jgi:CRP-like cAMP-binding protein